MMEFLFWFMKPDNISIAHYILLCGQTHGIFQSWQLRYAGTPDAFLKSMDLFFTLWKVKQYSAKSQLDLNRNMQNCYFCCHLYSVCYLLDKTIYGLGMGLVNHGVFWLPLDHAWISHVIAHENLREEKPFIALWTLLFPWGLSNCGLWNIWPSRFIDGGILSIKINLKDVSTSFFSNHNWPLNTEVRGTDLPPSPSAVKNLHITFDCPKT